MLSVLLLCCHAMLGGCNMACHVGGRGGCSQILAPPAEPLVQFGALADSCLLDAPDYFAFLYCLQFLEQYVEQCIGTYGWQCHALKRKHLIACHLFYGTSCCFLPPKPLPSCLSPPAPAPLPPFPPTFPTLFALLCCHVTPLLYIGHL